MPLCCFEMRLRSRCYVGVVVDPLARRARIRHAKASLAGGRIALGVHRFVNRRVGIPTNRGVAIDL